MDLQFQTSAPMLRQRNYNFEDIYMNKNNTLVYNNSSIIKHDNVNITDFNHIIWMLAAFSLLAGGAFVFGRYFCQPKKSIQDNTTSLLEAISRCKEETDNQNFEVKVITNALNEFNQESRFLAGQNTGRRRVAVYGLFQVANEQTALLETREKVESIQQLEELIALTANYPESGYKDNPCIETVESYLEARKVHHGKIVSLATVLLPNLGALMTAARAVNNALIVKNTI